LHSGTYAAQTLLQTRRPISQLRGKIESWRGIPAVATFHPAYLLRNAAQKASAWQDCRLILQMLRGESPTAHRHSRNSFDCCGSGME